MRNLPFAFGVLIYISLIVLLIDRYKTYAIKMEDDEYCDLLPNCLCMESEVNGIHWSEFDCEFNLTVKVESTIHKTEVKPNTLFKVLCDPKLPPSSLVQDYYSLLNLNRFPSEISLMHIRSCPSPPMSYLIFISPSPSKELFMNVRDIVINTLKIECHEFKGQFLLQRINFLGFASLKELNITCPTLSEIPYDLFKNTTPLLNTLTISSKSLFEISKDVFSSLPNLQDLTFTNSSITTFPVGLFDGLLSLLKLDVSYNKLISLNENLFDYLEKLILLNLKGNSLSSMSNNTKHFPNLVELDASYNMFTDFHEFDNLSKLKKINLQNNRIKHLHFTNVTWYYSIQHIDVSSNPILEISKIPVQMDNLLDFVLNDNYGTNLTIQQFIKGKSIKNFIISNSSIISLHPMTLKDMPELRRVDFSKNFLWDLPSTIFSENLFLHNIEIQENYILNLDANIIANNPNLLIFNISHNKISELPSLIFSLNHQLDTLDISGNAIKDLPSILLFNQTKLQVLRMSDNKISSLHPSFFNTTINIRELDFRSNQLDNLPKDIFLPFKDNIVHLDLSRNQISALPSFPFSVMKYLNLSHNKIEILPEGIFRDLKSIEFLLLSHNRINRISDSPLLHDSAKAKVLDLSWNNLFNIPQRMFSSHFIYIHKLDFSKNSLWTFNIDYISQIKYMKELYISNNNMSLFTIDNETVYMDNEKMFITLKILDLSNNMLDFSESEWSYIEETRNWGKYTVLNNFQDLEVLQLSNNSISRIFLDWRHSLRKLQLLDLSYNKINRLYYQDMMITTPLLQRSATLSTTINRIDKSGPFPCPPLPLTIDLRWNLVQSVDIPFSKIVPVTLTRDGKVPEGFYSRATILIGENPFVCDCKILNLMRVVQNDVALVSDLKKETGKELVMPARIDIKDLRCWEPSSLNGKAVSEPETWMHHLVPLFSMCQKST